MVGPQAAPPPLDLQVREAHLANPPVVVPGGVGTIHAVIVFRWVRNADVTSAKSHWSWPWWGMYHRAC